MLLMTNLFQSVNIQNCFLYSHSLSTRTGIVHFRDIINILTISVILFVFFSVKAMSSPPWRHQRYPSPQVRLVCGSPSTCWEHRWCRGRWCPVPKISAAAETGKSSTTMDHRAQAPTFPQWHHKYPATPKSFYKVNFVNVPLPPLLCFYDPAWSSGPSLV